MPAFAEVSRRFILSAPLYLATACQLPKLRTTENLKPSEQATPEFLSREQQERIGLYVYSTPEVRLHIHKRALILDPLLKTLYEKNNNLPQGHLLKHANIVLVDDEILTQNSPIPEPMRPYYDNSSITFLMRKGDIEEFWIVHTAGSTVIHSIFVAVGGKEKPKQEQSCLTAAKLSQYSQEELADKEKQAEDNYTYLPLISCPGLRVRHGLKHARGEKRESKADFGAYCDFIEASKRYQTTGNKSEYYIVYETSEGLIYS